MSGDLVLITGASGHMGFRAVVDALEAGYNVRAAVRSQSKADIILAAPSIKTLSPDKKLQFVFVPEILADGAYDEAVKDVKYVIHIASPLAIETDDYELDVIAPAVKGTTGILKSAIKNSTVKRVVITSSIIAVIPWQQFIMEEVDTVFTADDRIPDVHPPFGHPFQAYAASKANALNATDAFMKTENPSFDVVNVMPSFFIGKSELITSPKEITNGTNGAAFGQILGAKSDFPNPGAMNHVDDVAKVHVLSLNPKVKAQNFGVMSGGVAGGRWGDAIDIVKKHFPEAVRDGRLPANGTAPSKKLLFDASKTEKVLGIKFRSYEDQVVELTNHYLELLAKTGAKTNGHETNGHF